MDKKLIISVLFISFSVFISPALAIDYLQNDTTAVDFKRAELNTGLIFNVMPEREELFTEDSRNYQKSLTGSFKFGLKRRNWNFISYRQEYWGYSIEAGPFWGAGNTIDSTAAEEIEADHKIFGLRAMASGSYSGRFYYDRRNFTLISLDVWSGYDFYRKNDTGITTDSGQFTNNYSRVYSKGRLRAGFNAKAGWGAGRIDNINHFVAAARFLGKYYPERLFSEPEIIKVAKEIGRIKNRRKISESHSVEDEADQLIDFLNRNLLLEPPSNPYIFWELSEYSSRYRGTRFSIGPFFNYLNYEPDFIYGGYLHFEKEKYCGVKWNRSFSGNLSYNSYKRNDWITLEADLGWSYYPDIKSEIGFGLKYIPGVEVQSSEDFGPWGHNFIPYVQYFSQINSRWRVDMMMSLRVVSNDRFMVPGPEVSVNIYRSRY
jgi:hypothetical protein